MIWIHVKTFWVSSDWTCYRLCPATRWYVIHWWNSLVHGHTVTRGCLDEGWFREKVHPNGVSNTHSRAKCWLSTTFSDSQSSELARQSHAADSVYAYSVRFVRTVISGIQRFYQAGRWRSWFDSSEIFPAPIQSLQANQLLHWSIYSLLSVSFDFGSTSGKAMKWFQN